MYNHIFSENLFLKYCIKLRQNPVNLSLIFGRKVKDNNNKLMDEKKDKRMTDNVGEFLFS